MKHKLLVGIHIDPHKSITKLIERYQKILNHNGIDHIILDVNKPDFWDQVKKLDLFIFHYYGTEKQHQLALSLLPIIEIELGIRCFPSAQVSWLYDDKIREYYFLKQHGYPVIPTSVFWDKQSALKWIETADLPVVFKLSGGASSENVVLVKRKSYGKRLINRMFGSGIVSGHVPGLSGMRYKNIFTAEHLKRLGGKYKRRLTGGEGNPFEIRHKNYVLFQKYLHGNTTDIRVHVIGGRAFCDMRYVRKGDFRASGSGKCNLDHNNMDKRCIGIAFDIAKKFDFQSMALDFLYDENKSPLISEISYTQPDWGIWMDEGYWDKNFNWNSGHYWPQYFILMDMLKLPDLKQPVMEPEVNYITLPKNL